MKYIRTLIFILIVIAMVWFLAGCASIKSYTTTDKNGNEVKVIEAMGLGNIKEKLKIGQ